MTRLDVGSWFFFLRVASLCSTYEVHLTGFAYGYLNKLEPDVASYASSQYAN